MPYRASSSVAASVFVLFWSGLATAQAPLIENVTMSAGSDLQLLHQGPGLQSAAATLPAGTAFGSGVVLGSQAGDLASSLFADSVVDHREVSLQFHAAMCEIASTAWTAHVPEQSVLVQLQVPQAMRLRFDSTIATLVGQGMPSTRGTIDVGDDGRIEQSFSTPIGVCDSDNITFEREVPAGTLLVRFTFSGDLPTSRDPLACRVVNVSMLLDISPAHAAVTDEGGACNLPLWVEPVLDGQSVELGVHGTVSGSLAWLIVGGDTVDLLLPASTCSLLVRPDLLLLGTPWLQQTLPLGLYGPGHLYVQGAIWQPATWAGGQAQFLATHRHRIDLR